MASEKNKDGGWFGWALIIFCFLTEALAPLGVVLLMIKLFGADARRRKKGLPPPKQSDPSLKPGGRTANAPEPQPVQPRPRPKNAVTRAVTRPPAPRRASAVLLKLGGAVLLGVGLMIAGSALEEMLLYDFSEVSLWLPEMVQALAFGIGGGAMLGAGISMGRGLRRYAKYLSVMGDRDAVPVDELARTLGLSERRVRKDLQKMLDKGYFGGRAYLHVEAGMFFRGDEAAERFRRAQAAMEAERAPKEVEEGYSGILRSIRRANDAIADPVLSAKIDRLEEIAGKIFLAVEEDPRKRGKLDTFLNYYLPTTQKLLDSYAEFESAGVEGENLCQAKQRIQTTMDTIIKGFEHQLDELYQSDALDVDSDIRVLETMLRWDTASAEQDFGTGTPEEKADGKA